MGAQSSGWSSTDSYIFVAHKSGDKPKIRPIVEALLRLGFSVWIDAPEKFEPRLAYANLHRLTASKIFQLTIPERIRSAGCVLVIWSAEAVNSPDVLAEASQAYELDKLVAIRTDDAMPEWVLRWVTTRDLTALLGAHESDFSGHRDFLPVVADIREKISAKPRFAWEHYQGLFSPGAYQIAFVPFLNREKPLLTTFKFDAITINRDVSLYKLPEEFKATQIDAPHQDLTSCRLIQWGKTGSTLDLTVSPVQYSDYLKSGEHLDAPLPNDRKRTFREHFANAIPEPDVNLRRFPLTNICGVGLFIITLDGEVLITRHSPHSHVYPGRWTFSASGTMRWGASPNPFTEVLWKCRQETGHQVDMSQLELVELGVDARKLFFEFCFVERTHVRGEDLIKGLPSKLEYELVPLSQPAEIAERVTTRCWEPAAEATLLALAMQKNGIEKTSSALDKLGNLRHHQMLDEWDFRASRPGNLAVMSVRYPQDRLERESSDYVRRVLEFIGEDIKDKRVLEVGSGIGRITRELVQLCSHVTCVDLCERMHKRNEESHEAHKRKVRLQTCFIQDFKTARKFDVAVCSLVLVHNVEPAEFEEAIQAMCRSANCVFVFEDTTEGRRTSRHTSLLSDAKLQEAFAKQGFMVERTDRYQLFEDTISFFKFVGGQKQARPGGRSGSGR